MTGEACRTYQVGLNPRDEKILPESYFPVRGAVNNGASEIEIRETLLQTAVYCGAPTGMASFRVADATIQQLKEEGKLPK